MKIQQISKYVMYAVLAVSLVVFAMFFGFWGDEMVGEFAAPTFTSLLQEGCECGSSKLTNHLIAPEAKEHGKDNKTHGENRIHHIF